MIKKIIIVIFIISIFCLVGCTDISQYVPIDEYYNNLVELDKANSETESKSLEILGLKQEVNNLENDLADLELGLELKDEEIEKYNNLISNLNNLLNNVYYVYGEGNGTWVAGIGFSLEYKDKIYLITAGHIVDGEWGIHKNLGFKDIDNKWIYPKLLTYEVNEIVPDYAIFYSDKINNGLKVDLNNTEPDYRLGINKLIQENNNWGLDGECGSPIIDLDGEVIGIHVGYVSDIDDVLEAIDNLE